MRPRGLLVAFLALILPGIVLAPVWPLAGLGADEDDVLYYYPMRAHFGQTIRAGQPPWLNPWTGMGRPFAADPQTAVAYPFTWLFVPLPPTVAYAASLWAHYSLAFYGAYRLLRSKRLDRRAATFGAVAFAFCGFLLAHRAHFAMQHAAAWTPWVFWRLERYARQGGLGRLGWVAAAGALQCFAGHVQIAAISLLGTLVYLAASMGIRGRVVGRWLLAWVMVGGLFAVQWWPTLLYLGECTRANRAYWMFVENSWHPVSVVGWVLPMLFGQRTPNFFPQHYWGPSHQVEQFGYSGILVLLLGAAALVRGWRRPDERGWSLVLIFSLMLALGKFGPVCPLLYWIPGADVFRVPARGMVLFHLALCALAAGAVHRLGAPFTPDSARLRATLRSWAQRPITWLVVLIGAPLLLLLAVSPFLDAAARRSALAALDIGNPAIWVPVLALAVTIGVLAYVARRWDRPGWLWLLVPTLIADLSVIGWTLDVPKGVRDARALLSPAGREAWLPQVRGSGERVWVVSDTAGVYSNPVLKGVSNTNMLCDVPALTDYGPLQPRSLDRLFEFTPWGVTARADALLADSAWMRSFNVGWVLLCEDRRPAPEAAALVTTTPEGFRLYRCPDAAGYAFLEDPAQPAAIRSVEHSPHSFTTWVDTWHPRAPASPAGTRLVVSRLALTGWRASVGGRALPIEAAAGALLSVRVPVGETVEIEWSYFPPGLMTGAIVSAVSGAALVVMALIAALQRARP